MNKLVSVSKILYDKEIIEKNKEIIYLKDKLFCFENPIIIFDCIDDWYQQKYVFFKIIEKTLTDSIINNYEEFQKTMEFQAELEKKTEFNILTKNQYFILKNSIKCALELFTKNNIWSEKISSDLIDNIQALLYSCSIISECSIIKKFNNNLQFRSDLSNIIMQFIKYKFGYEINSQGLLTNISFIKCKICKNLCKLYEKKCKFCYK